MNRPNILVFMTDQQHAETIGPAGLCRTPHLDALMKEGVTFRQAFTACPMCTPSRASVMTGLYPHQHRLVMNAHAAVTLQDRLSEGTETLASALQKEGYRTAYAGKWHVGSSSPTEHGFAEELQKVPPSASAGSDPPNIRDRVLLKDQRVEKVLAGSLDLPVEEAEEFRLAGGVSAWIDAHKDEEEPFFLFVSCTKPHVPWIVPEPYASMYDPRQIEEWPSYRDDLNGKPETYRKNYLDINFCRLQHQWSIMAKALSKYYGLVSLVDEAFGRIVNKLAETGLLDDTLIVFTSDHGEMMGRHGLIGKTAIALDDLIRVPLVVYWKGVLEHRECDDLVSLQDLFNTLLEAAVARWNPNIHSDSFMPSLLGIEYDREAIFVEHHGTTALQCMRAIRTQRYKYVFRAHELDELYDLERDPMEMDNRIRDSAYRDVRETLRRQLVEWATATGDYAKQAMISSFTSEAGVVFEMDGEDER